MNNLKNMLVLKDLPSNLIKEAYIVLNPELNRKFQEVNSENEDNNETEKIKRDKDYILQEAKFVLLNYISKFEEKVEKKNIRSLEKKYLKLKRITIGLSILFLIYIVITNIF